MSHSPILNDPLRVLHVAPETALARKLRSCPNLHYISADLDPHKADVQMDIMDIGYPDGHFDVILCSHVLEHVPDALLAMTELLRVLSPSGFALLDVPIREDLDQTYEDWSITSAAGRAAAFGQSDHVRWFGRDYPDVLRSAGFSVAVDPHPLPEAEMERFGIQRSNHVIYCTKPS